MADAQEHPGWGVGLRERWADGWAHSRKWWTWWTAAGVLAGIFGLVVVVVAGDWIHAIGVVMVIAAALLLLLSIVMTVYHFAAAPARIRWQREADERAGLKAEIDALKKERISVAPASGASDHVQQVRALIDSDLAELAAIRAQIEWADDPAMRRKYLEYRKRCLYLLGTLESDLVEAAFTNVSPGKRAAVDDTTAVPLEEFMGHLDEHRIALEKLKIAACPATGSFRVPG
jgi:hypothetical protein